MILEGVALKKDSSKSVVPATRDRAYYDGLTESELDAQWAQRVALGITRSEELLLRHVLRERKGFKPVETFVSICQRCNLPADNCACHR